MSDASSLRSLLKRTDLTAPAIQAAAGAMMKHYDKSAGVAVTEWRNALQQAREEQYLPLLYVANEVLQNSKRNRGNKFLEAFSPTLGQSLIYLCQRSSASTVDKIRRTVKIWGERHVFSVRFVNELLKGLEPYRKGGNTKASPLTNSQPSPLAGSSPAAISTASIPEPEIQPETSTGMDGIDDDQDDEVDVDRDDEDDDNDLFGNASSKLLKIDLDLDQATKDASSTKKRRRANGSPTGMDASTQRSSTTATSKSSKRRSVVLSTSSLMELWSQVASLQMQFDRVHGALQQIDTPQLLDEDSIQEKIDTLVGDELLKAYKKTIQYEEDVIKHRRELYDIAQRRKALELEAVRYLPWLESALKHDEEDAKFCDQYLEQLKLFYHVHKPSKEARDKRLKEEEQRRIKEEELRRKREEEEERKKFMESAMAKQTEAQPGMVWNKATGEYQYLNQDESWRD
ncbi:RNA polymerase II-binding domain containing protein [Nitzschia inconspicua]|uniref:RNA polymerase II-binding domain containing protein n=1 Tax=Nitzschia inconspicua TaxID=303405 RepID=A0A9K3PHN8_9STRA|nr:RNA polymerase II-binding domain containing protein [Nitzschia inconspicua]